MRILLTVGTTHGSTGEIGRRLAQELSARGHVVQASDPDRVSAADIVASDAVIIGSAIYMSRWLPQVRIVCEEYLEELRGKPVWAFSSGLAALRTGRQTVAEPDLLERMSPRGTAHFHGRLDPGALSLRERSITRLTRAPEGDFRDWDTITQWASEIDAVLVPTP